MSFKELLQKYIKGELTEQEQIFVEGEIEKNEVISEYLADQLDIDLETRDIDFKDSEIDNNKIKKAVNKKLRKVIGISVLSVFIILLSAKYIISPIVDTFYYDPIKKSTGEHHKDLYFDMRSYVELYLPGFTLYHAFVEPIGFGKYDITIEQKDLFTNDTEYTNISLVRNKKYGYFENLLPSRDLFIAQNDEEKEVKKDISKIHLNNLKKLPSSSYVAAYVDFPKDLSMEELLILESKFKNQTDSSEVLDFKWIAVRVAPKEKEIFDQIGFNPNPNDGPVSGDSADFEKYPYLAMIDYYSSKNISESWEKAMATGYELHFKSLLQYLYDRKDFTVSLDKRSEQGDFYKSSLKYIEKNGIKTYGVLVYGEVSDIISFMEDEITDSIYISNIKVSKFSKN